MKRNRRFIFFLFFIILAYLMSACSGVSAGQNTNTNDQPSQTGDAQEVVFTGTVDSIGNGQWTVGGQSVTVDDSTNADAGIVVGDSVKVDAVVSQDGSVTAVRIGLAVTDDNSNSNDNAANSDDSNTNASDNENGNANSNDSSTGVYPELTGVVDAITADSITIDGTVYALSNFTEYKDQVAVGDQVKVQILVNPDGTFTVREIELSNGTQVGNSNDNSNSNINGSDDDYSNANVNFNGSGNDDQHNGNSNGNSSDDDHEDSGGDD